MKREMMNMIKLCVPKLSERARPALVSFAMLAMWATHGAYPGLAQESAQPTFPSASEASQSLFRAVQANDEQAIANIGGGETNRLVALVSGNQHAQPEKSQEIASHERLAH